MNYFAPGLREMARLLDRLACRGGLFWSRRRLAQLESKLGLLGWQQADYGSDAQAHVDHLNEVERSQAQLHNESASIGLAILQLEERRASARAAYESERAARVAARDPLVGPVEEAERVLKDKQKECQEIEERLATIDKEKRAEEERYRGLLAKGSESQEKQDQIMLLQRRVMAIPLEAREWEQRLAKARAELSPLEMELEQRRSLLAVEVDAIRALEKSFADGDKALDGEIAARKREKQKLERKVEGLEKAKAKPYREIGRVLADHGIEPLNQPEALAAVLHQREKIAMEHARLAESLQLSARENRVEVWGSWALWFTLLVILVGAILLLTHLR